MNLPLENSKPVKCDCPNKRMISAEPVCTPAENFGILRVPVLDVCRNLASDDGEGAVHDRRERITENKMAEDKELEKESLNKNGSLGESKAANDSSLDWLKSNSAKEDSSVNGISGVHDSDVAQYGKEMDCVKGNEVLETDTTNDIDQTSGSSRELNSDKSETPKEKTGDEKKTETAEVLEESVDEVKTTASSVSEVSAGKKAENKDNNTGVDDGEKEHGSVECGKPEVKEENVSVDTDIAKYSRPWLCEQKTVNHGMNSTRDDLTCSSNVRQIDGESSHIRKFKCKTYNPEFEKTVKRNKENLMKFAETLYKCTLCMTIPSVLTSKESFLNHVHQHHLSQGEFFNTCRICSLKFRTEEDLKEHTASSHAESSKSASCNQSCDQIGSDVIESHDQENDSNNDSDSDSSGHRQYRAKVLKRTKPVHDFENPKQLVDHTGIETWNGSLDLSKKTPNECEVADSKISAQNTPKKDVNDINIKQITEQIIKSDVQCRNQSSDAPGNNFPFVPSFTPEFGKYTKLVREGGNIVYFCQICNWRSPIKTTFQAHCNMTSHKNKVANAENPDRVEKMASDTKSLKSSDNEKTTKLENNQSHKKHWPHSEANYGPKFPDQSLFYNYIVQARGMNPGQARTPVVSPFGIRNASMFDSAQRMAYKRLGDYPMNLAVKKRKRLHGNGIGIHRTVDSESDEEQNGELSRDVHKSSPSMALLRNRLLGSGYSNMSGGNKDGIGGDSKQVITCDLADTCGSVDLSKVKKEHGDKGKASERSSPLNMVKCDKMNDKNNLHKSVEHSPRLYKCHACSFEYSRIEEYERHFEKVHKSVLGNMLQAGSPDLRFPGSVMWTHSGAGIQHWMEAGSRAWEEKHSSSVQEGKLEGTRGKGVDGTECEMGENWRVQKLKELLPGKN